MLQPHHAVLPSSVGPCICATGEHSKSAYDLAYADIRAAFRSYIASAGGQPFILAGHSQGALHRLRLLNEEIAGPPLRDLLVATYLPGIVIPETALPSDIPLCSKASQTGCLAGWNAFLEDADIVPWKQRALSQYGSEAADAPIICVHPVSFSRAQPETDMTQAKGMLPIATRDGPQDSMIYSAVAARCENGMLRVRLADGTHAQPLPNGSMHMHEIAMFWADIAANANIRARSWLANAQARDRQAGIKPPDGS